jgi:hypothetical protein
VRAVAVALLILISGWGMSTASARSRPGDLLYPLKIATEKVRFALTVQPEGRAELRLTFADTRLAELVERTPEQGAIDQALLKGLLREAELALDEAQTVPDERFQLFIRKLQHFNAYHQEALTRLGHHVPPHDARALNEAISLCQKRHRWIGHMQQAMDTGRPVERRWGPGCRCR